MKGRAYLAKRTTLSRAMEATFASWWDPSTTSDVLMLWAMARTAPETMKTM